MKKIFVLLFLSILFLSWIPYKGKALYGQTKTELDVKADFSNFFNKSNQTNIQNYISENFGLRNVLVRIRNDIVFLLNGMQQPYNKDFLLGSDDTLFSCLFFNEYFTNNRESRDKIVDNNVLAIKKFYDFFKRMGVPVIVILAPEKSLTLYNNLPFIYKEALNKSSKFYVPLDRYEHKLQEYGIKVINAQSLVSNFSDPSKTFPKGGLHWNQQGASIAAEALYAELTKAKLYPEIIETKQALNEEEDIRFLQNTHLISPRKNEKYTSVTYKKNEKPEKSYFWVYGDSFSNQLNTLIEKTGIALDGQSNFIHNRLLDSKTIYNIISHKSVLILCYTVPHFLNSRVANDLTASLGHISTVMCIQDCQPDGWVGKAAEYATINSFKNKLNIKLLNVMPTVNSFQIKFDNGYEINFRIKEVNAVGDQKSIEIQKGETVTLTLPESFTKIGSCKFLIKVDRPVSPIALDQSLDRRKLGVFLKFEWAN